MPENMINNDSSQAVLVQQVQAVAQELGINQTQLAKQIGVGASVLNQWVAEKYKGSNEKVTAAAKRWLLAQERGQEIPVFEPPKFVETPTATKIMDVLTDAQTNGELAVIYGGAGVGKTEAIKAYVGQSNNVWHVTMSPAAASAGNCLDEICCSLGIDAGGRAVKAQRALIKFLKDSHGILIPDEAQHLSTSALETLRSIFDMTGVGMVLVGNDSVYAKLTGGRRAAEFAQLYSRIGQRLKIVKPTRADVLAIIEAWHVEDKESKSLLVEIANKPGGLRGMIKTLRVAAQMTDSTPSTDDLRAAWEHLAVEA